MHTLLAPVNGTVAVVKPVADPKVGVPKVVDI